MVKHEKKTVKFCYLCVDIAATVSSEAEVELLGEILLCKFVSSVFLLV